MVGLLQWIFSGVLLGALYASIAIAFIVVYRGTRVFNFAAGELVMLGGFLVWTMIDLTPLPLWLSTIVGIGLCAMLGAILDRLTIRPLIGQSLFSMVMVTIALVLVLRSAAMLIWGPRGRPFPALFGTEPVHLGPFIFNSSMFYGFIVVCLLVVALWWLFSHTTRGLTMSAVAEDHQVARALGINIKQSMTIAWAIAGAISAIAAIIYMSGRAVSYLGAEIGLRALPVALFAGLESIPGALLAGIIVGICESLAMGYLDKLTEGGMSLITPFLIMLIILWARPQGLFGWKIIERL